jgi:AcrR family transcriptional regulator
VGRRPQPERRAELLARCTDELLRTGCLSISLSRLAASAGTSARMLVYHFGTRDNLLRELLHEARRRQQEVFGATLQPVPGRPYLDNIREMWVLLSDPAAAPYVRLFRRVHDDADGRRLWPEFRQISVLDWLPAVRAGLAADGFDHPTELATALIALVRGLRMDVTATGDVDRTAAAFSTVIHLLGHAQHRGGSSAVDQRV